MDQISGYVYPVSDLLKSKSGYVNPAGYLARYLVSVIRPDVLYLTGYENKYLVGYLVSWLAPGRISGGRYHPAHP